jgi:hypothetical protein
VCGGEGVEVVVDLAEEGLVSDRLACLPFDSLLNSGESDRDRGYEAGGGGG